MRIRFIYILICLIAATGMVSAQGYVDQDRARPLFNAQGIDDIKSMKKVTWHTYKYDDNIEGNGMGSWSEFEAHLDSLPGARKDMRRYIVEFANRVTGDNFKKGNELLIPDEFPEDYRAYSPYPFHYSEADSLTKLFIIDKYTQTFAAYENGWLVRWGIVSTGSTNGKTPAGRYNFNWKSELRESSAAPPGETWTLPYMFNFHAGWGLHVHQYALPIDQPASHGCVRMTMADAIWNYEWADGWVKDNGKLVRNGTPVIVINANPADRRADHWEYYAESGVTSLVKLPEDVYNVPAGTYAQEIRTWAVK